MQEPKYLNKISGWILTDGKWHPTEEWWHINAIYDLKENGYPVLQSKETKEILMEGDESKIRDHLAVLGFIKISRSQIDGIKLNISQLVTLQNLLSLCNPDDEIGILGSNGVLKFIRISRIMKLKNPDALFD
ncbi:hypothetical protein [Silvanigrella sp.]|jgi:hypothetical protein|uniref:hypothetical protein n=1 Tax=Silvanigrella sp. TaxID=2024976 RepID=UPI0037C5B2A8